jgi:hypothetical protein
MLIRENGSPRIHRKTTLCLQIHWNRFEGVCSARQCTPSFRRNVHGLFNAVGRSMSIYGKFQWLINLLTVLSHHPVLARATALLSHDPPTSPPYLLVSLCTAVLRVHSIALMFIPNIVGSLRLILVCKTMEELPLPIPGRCDEHSRICQNIKNLCSLSVFPSVQVQNCIA